MLDDEQHFTLADAAEQAEAQLQVLGRIHHAGPTRFLEIRFTLGASIHSIEESNEMTRYGMRQANARI